MRVEPFPPNLSTLSRRARDLEGIGRVVPEGTARGARWRDRLPGRKRLLSIQAAAFSSWYAGAEIGKARKPVPVTEAQAHGGGIAVGEGTKAVVLDLEQPVRVGEWLGTAGQWQGLEDGQHGFKYKCELGKDVPKENQGGHPPLKADRRCSFLALFTSSA
jgi:hypothetical protein